MSGTSGPTNGLVRAAAAVIDDAEGRILLVQQDYGHLRWGLPGAHIEPTDPPEDAVVREILRELGIEVRVQSLLGIYHLYGGEDALPDLLTYAIRCEIASGEPVINERGRIRRLGWYPSEALPPPATVTARAVAGDLAADRSGVVRRLER